MSDLHKPHLDAALVLYCTWLNSFSEDASDDSFTYTPAHFTDTTVNDFAEPTLIAEYDIDAYRAIVWQLSDGDDGGPASITAYFDYDAEPDELRHATQHFDTYITVFVKDGIVTQEGQS